MSQQILRLRKKHDPKTDYKGPPPDAQKLVAEQSVPGAIAGGLAVMLVLGWGWAIFAMQTGKVFTWFSILIGAAVGFAVRRYGRGLDWRFPLIAAIVAGAGGYVGNLMIGILETGRYIEAQPMRVAAGLSRDTMENFFAYTVNAVDHIYAFSAAALAAFLANRRLNRREVLALRTMAQTGDREQA